ncbi:MAG: A24 family peptidase [Proteobacteria bacterium]|nr:A24 family peptidase [Pseudomonadota bacterium]MDE3207283.1 prepilin peptidase [Pseudomonadota bacterium]
MHFLQQEPTLFSIIITISGLLIGSFLNVLIHRLPTMLERQWQQDCQSLLDTPLPQKLPTYNLLTPGSHCPHCSRPIRILENLPIISFLVLGGKCAGCKKPISKRYPLIELSAALLSFFIAWHFGIGLKTISGLYLAYSLIALTAIDLDRQLLPDFLTLPLLWAGLIFNLGGTFSSIQNAVIGAIAGYLSLWLVFWAFKLLTGKEGMGYGDFKLFSALGAWFGWISLPAILLMASLTGACVGLYLILFKKHSRNNPIPFGPYLAGGGIIFLFFGPELTHLYFP